MVLSVLTPMEFQTRIRAVVFLLGEDNLLLILGDFAFIFNFLYSGGGYCEQYSNYKESFLYPLSALEISVRLGKEVNKTSLSSE